MMQRTSLRQVTIQSLLNGKSLCLEENDFESRSKTIHHMDDFPESSTVCSSDDESISSEGTPSEDTTGLTNSYRRRRASARRVLVEPIQARAADLAVAAIGSDFTDPSVMTCSKRELLKRLHTGFSQEDSLLADVATAGLRLKHLAL